MTYLKYKIPFLFYDIFFIIWKPNSFSKIHNHSKNGCYMFILSGNLIEEIYSKKLKKIGTNFFSTFNLSYIDDNIGYHKIINSNNHTYTLNIYRPKNHKTIYYN